MKRLLISLLCLLSFAAHAAHADPVSLVFAGDIVLVGQPGKLIADGQDPFDGVDSILRNADIRVGNLECVVATTGTPEDKIFTFRADPQTLGVLKRHFDAVSVANNHSGDYGHAAFAEMLGLLDQVGIARFGGGHDLAEAHKPLILEKKGLRIALLGYNEFMPRSFEADAGTPGTAWSEDEQVASDIRRARSEYHADLVIPIMHWGWENERVGNARQKQLAHLMVEAGADAVIGGHPHVTQDVEIYRGKPIVYSVGNFLIDSLDNDAQTHGWVVKLELTKAGVQAWRTYAVDLNDAGVPHLAAQEKTPCGEGEKIGTCNAE